MPWLDATAVLKLAGYTAGSPLSAEHQAAVAFAEQAIAQRTGLVWGETRGETVTVRLNAASYHLRLPKDVQSVEDVSPAIGASELFELDGHLLQRFDSSYDQLAWKAGTYRVEVVRGINDVPQAVTRAAALLAGHYLSLADPERSRYDHVSLGDFAGTERRDAFPVPAAEQLLRPWISSVAVAS